MLHLCPFRIEKGVNKQSKIHFHVAEAVFCFLICVQFKCDTLV